MRIQYCSDLHFEFAENIHFLTHYPIKPLGEILILAGDITNLSYFKTRNVEKLFFKQLSKQFEKVFWICGNHEFYRSWDVSILDKPLRLNVTKNIHLVNNFTTIYRGIRLVFTTLWSHINELEGLYIEKNMSDFQLINYQGRKLTTGIYTQRLHNPSVDFLVNTLPSESDIPTVVVSHHLPSLSCVHPKHKGSMLEQGFASNLDALILEKQPTYWIYGHSHAHIPSFKIGSTTLLTNQLGYCKYGEHGSFDEALFFEIP